MSQKNSTLSRKQKLQLARQCRTAIIAYAKRYINRIQYAAIRSNILAVGGQEIFERELRQYFSDQIEKGNPRGSF